MWPSTSSDSRTMRYSALWRISGLAPGYEGQVIARALEQHAEAFPAPPAGEREGRSQRMLDALTALAQDYLDGMTSWADGRPGTGSGVTVFVDAGDAAGTSRERGGVIAAGPRIGPDTFDRVACEGSGVVVGMADGRPCSPAAAPGGSHRPYALPHSNGMAAA